MSPHGAPGPDYVEIPGSDNAHRTRPRRSARGVAIGKEQPRDTVWFGYRMLDCTEPLPETYSYGRT
jgi:hypothetical protein